MTRYESREELADKIDWEGGLLEAINGYGIKASDIPEPAPRRVIEAWKRIEDISDDVDLINEWLGNG